MNRKIGDTVIILIGKYKGQSATIQNIELNSGARNGWFTVLLGDGTRLLYAGEEIR